MAITKLMHMKESSTGTSSHLKNAINYILNDEKTKGGSLVGGNCGLESDEIYQQMLATKEEWGKTDGRQGYHFVISFDKFEVNEKQCSDVTKEFCKKFFGDNYEYVYATHNDQDHMHAHIIFNSVSRSTGLKFQYKNGDWAKDIQPMVDEICIKHNLEPLKYEKGKQKGKEYVEHISEKENKMTWKKIISGDIDFVIARSNSMKEFEKNMKHMGYELRYGTSKKHGEYLSMKVPGSDRARRNYSLGKGYSLEDIEFRIKNKEQLKSNVAVAPRLKRTNINKRPKNVSSYQGRRIRFVNETYNYRQRSFKSQYKVDYKTVRKQLLQIDKISASCNYLLENNIQSAKALLQRETVVYEAEKLLKTQRSMAYSTNDSKENIEKINHQLRELRQEKQYIQTNKALDHKSIGIERRRDDKGRDTITKR